MITLVNGTPTTTKKGKDVSFTYSKVELYFRLFLLLFSSSFSSLSSRFYVLVLSIVLYLLSNV
jgi:hypothetical protein